MSIDYLLWTDDQGRENILSLEPMTFYVRAPTLDLHAFNARRYGASNALIESPVCRWDGLPPNALVHAVDELAWRLPPQRWAEAIG